MQKKIIHLNFTQICNPLPLQLSALQRKYEECLVMLEDSRKYMTAMSPTQPLPTVHQAPLMPTPSIMNELEDAIYNDLQVLH